MIEDEVADQVVLVLREFVDVVRRRVSKEVGGARFDGVDNHSLRQPYASFALKKGDDEVILAVYLRRTPDGLTCEADLATYHEALSEMPMLRLSNGHGPHAVSGLLESVRAYSLAQVDRVVEILEGDWNGGS